MMRTILSTTKIKKKYDLTVALQGVSIDVKANEFVAVLGKKWVRQKYFISYNRWTINAR